MGTNTGLGIGIGIPFKNNALGGDKPYFPPELKARMIGVWTNYGKKNTDADRNIIKNKIPNAGGDLEILNAAYKLNSGFGEYSEDFTTWNKSNKITSVDSESFDFVTNVNLNLLYYKSNIGKDIPSFKVRIKLKGKGKVYYNYVTSEGVFTTKAINSEEYITPISYNTKYTGETPVNCGFTISISNECSGTITQIPNFEDAFVTDGVNDLIISQKTVKEMIGDNDEITVISMVYYINTDVPARISITNDVRGMTAEDKSSQVFARNGVKIEGVGKLGIYGWSKKGASTTVYPYFNILGDKTDYESSANYGLADDAKFCPVGEPSLRFMSKQAHYWSFMVIGKLTEDEINLIIGNYNLDRSLKPDILCNISKQGITNDNHAEFNDKLIDYSGNGRDIQMNNLAWKGGSGIAAKQYETFKDWTSEFSSTSIITQIDEFTRVVESTTNGYWVSRIRRDSDLNKVYDAINVYLYQDNNFLVHECKYEVDGIKYAIPINESVGKGYHKLEMYTKDRYTKLPENAENVVLSEWYFPKSKKGSIKYSVIPSYKGGILLDGVNDFGKVTGMPIYKDYTVVTDREIFANIGAILSKNNPGAFVETTGNSVYSFGQVTSGLNFISTRSISYLSKYSYCGQSITAGAAEDGTDMWLGTIRDNDHRFFNGAIYSLMSFPYSMSEFLIERQLKKHKLGTLYPDMVEFRPIVKSNVKYQDIIFRNASTREDLVAGQYYDLEAISIFIKPNNIDEVSNVRVNNTNVQFHSYDSNSGYYRYDVLINKSPQKINITIDEYIRFEDIVQPYPVLLRFKDENGNEVSWGGKFKVGSTITRISSIADPESNLLNGLYSISGLSLNGKGVTSSTSIVEKQMVFKTIATYLLDNNEPNCILSPRLLRIPNSSYKILGHIPDISGHGNHGVIHNSAYGEGSGVNEDGSYQFDGVNDFVTIPTLSSGGKQMLMKVNWQKSSILLYDQRASGSFAVLTTKEDDAVNSRIAYQGRNLNGKTYIDGIENNNIETYTLKDITHNITIANSSLGAIVVPAIGCNTGKTSNFAKMSLYDFMLFDEISTDDKIKELNEYVGIEAKVELPPYYWDNYGKTNLDADKATIQQRGTAVGDYDLTNYNHAYEGMSGYNGYPVVFGVNKTWVNKSNGYVTSITSNTIHITNVLNAGLALLYSYVKYNGNLQNIKEIPPFKIEIKGLEGRSKFIYKYLATSDATKETNLYLGNGTHELPKSFLPTEVLINNAVVGFSISPIEEGVTNFLSDITIEVLPEYENGLAYDGVEDFSDNKNIPIFTDFTAIIKRIDLDAKNNNSAVMFKGNKIYESSIGNGFILDYHYNSKNYVYSYSKINQIERDDSKIIYLTPESYNGNPIIKGENEDNLGLKLGKYWKGIIYKTILYSKTISLLEINFLKNLMEKDEIIDLTNPIFIKNE